MLIESAAVKKKARRLAVPLLKIAWHYAESRVFT
jgi:hypothetical protein